MQGGGQPLQEASSAASRPEARGSWNRWPLGLWLHVGGGCSSGLGSSWGSRGLSQEMVEEVLTSFRVELEAGRAASKRLEGTSERTALT